MAHTCLHALQVDVTKLDIGLIKNYCMWLAASTWRQLMVAQMGRWQESGGSGQAVGGKGIKSEL